jgi:plasmid stabilization system protein ParE
MVKSYSLTPLARANIRAIVAYIAARNPAAARNAKAAMLDACQKLGEQPYMGQRREDLTTQPVLFWPVYRRYMIVYDATKRPVPIVMVYDAARDPASVLVSPE